MWDNVCRHKLATMLAIQVVTLTANIPCDAPEGSSRRVGGGADTGGRGTGGAGGGGRAWGWGGAGRVG